MAEPLDRRRFLAASTAAAAGTLLPIARIAAAEADARSSPAPFSAEELTSGLLLRNGAESIRITVCAPDVIHVVAAGRGMPDGASPVTPWITAAYGPQTPEVTRTQGRIGVRTPKISAEMDLEAGLLHFRDAGGKSLLRESERVPRRYVPQRGAETLYRVEQRFFPDALEGIYGLGQHQGGAFDQRGTVVELAQANTNVAIPLFVSTLGYGLLWNTAARSRFDNRFPTELKLSAEATEAIDYYVFYGPSIDRIIQLYRGMTGRAPLFGRWAYGFVQSKTATAPPGSCSISPPSIASGTPRSILSCRTGSGGSGKGIRTTRTATSAPGRMCPMLCANCTMRTCTP